MLTHGRSLAFASFLAALLLLFPVQSWSAGLPEGMTVDLIAEYPVQIPGLEKVQLKKMTMQPGTVLKEFTVPVSHYCTVTQGMFTVVDHTAGTTTVYVAGSRFAPTKGHIVTVSNPGDELAVQWNYYLIEKK